VDVLEFTRWVKAIAKAAKDTNFNPCDRSTWPDELLDNIVPEVIDMLRTRKEIQSVKKRQSGE
jgi:hypothetical protein